MKILSILLSVILVAGQWTMAQTIEPKISFEKVEHDFGTIQEDAGKVSYRFDFVNTGGAPLVITNVKTTCGCTAPDWSRTPVAPGDKGYVDVTFNPRGYKTFRKSITVTANGEPSIVRLHVSGVVEPKPLSVEEEYRHNASGLRFKSQHVAFGNIGNTQTRTLNVDLVNTTDKPMKIEFDLVPSHITLKAVPETLKPNEKGIINATYNARLKQDWDYVMDRIFLVVNGDKESRNYLNISAVIVEDFSNLSQKEKEDAPQIGIDSKTFDFGTLKKGEKVSHKFLVSNNGNSPLVIRKVKASCGCTAVQPSKRILQKGEQTQIEVTFDSTHKSGNQNQNITLISNDPSNSRTVLWMRGRVEE